MRHRWWVAAIAGLLLVMPCAWGQDGIKFFALDQIRPGQRGVGRTVFAGDKIDEFQVEILGVLKNAIAPKQDLILARLSGGPLESTGVIAGMSGSPVYIDGKLVSTHTSNIPSAPAYIMINHWGTNSTGWGGQATIGVQRYLYVSSFTYTPYE